MEELSLKKYRAEPTMRLFHKDNSLVRGIMGPFGSGKSVACCMEILIRGQNQQPSLDGIRKTRWAIIRNCYDDKTEILTEKRGFQLFRNLQPNDRVATLQNDELVYELPNGISVHPYTGDMIGFQSEGVDFLVTPDHEMWVSQCTTREKTWGKYHMEHAETVYKTGRNYHCYRVRRDAKWHGTRTQLSVAQYEWLGFWFAEGSSGVYKNRTRITLTQIKPDGIRLMKQLTKAAGYAYVEHKRDKGVNLIVDVPANLRHILLSAGQAGRKHLPANLLEASRTHHAAFLRGFVAGDGHVRQEGTTTMYTSSSVLADQLQEIALKAGRVATVSNRDRRGRSVNIGSAHGKVNHVEYIVTLLGRTKHQPHLYVNPRGNRRLRGWYRQPYNGLVYCAEMDIPTVYVRRNGKAFWCNRTYPELVSTSMKTWQAWVPDAICPIKREKNGPLVGHMVMDMPDGTKMDLEVYFIALDREEEVGKLKSLELTGVWMNEVAEMGTQAILDMLTGRINRYPSKEDVLGLGAPEGASGCTWTGIIMDTNPPDDDHWYYRLAEILRPEGYAFYKQPPAVILLPKTNPKDPDEYAPNMGQSVYPKAENIRNLNGGYDYYMKQQVPGKDSTWIRVFLMVQYGTVMSGKPVYRGEYNDDVHCAKEELKPYRGLPLLVSFDFGLTPVCTFSQFDPKGQFRVIDELIANDMGIRNFAVNVVRPYIRSEYHGMTIHAIGDPTGGGQRSQTEEQTCFDILAEEGFAASPAKTNEFIARRESVARFLTRMSDGRPAFILSPRCQQTRKGFISRYRYKEVRGAGGLRHSERPEKNHPYSDLHDSIQYACMEVESLSTSGVQHPDSPTRARNITPNRRKMSAWT